MKLPPLFALAASTIFYICPFGQNKINSNSIPVYVCDSNFRLTMQIRSLFTSLVAVLIVGADPTPNCPPKPSTPQEQRQIFETFINSFYVKKNITEAFLNHVAEDYIQHNPNFQSGRQVAMDGLKNYVPTLNITVAKIGLSDNTGWVLAKQVVAGKPSYTVVVDIFRMNGSCVVEHWDVIQARPTDAKNPLAMLDGI
jgi:predicted SnoaL-like aldol condensation-catalyzing enzyme